MKRRLANPIFHSRRAHILDSGPPTLSKLVASGSAAGHDMSCPYKCDNRFGLILCQVITGPGANFRPHAIHGHRDVVITQNVGVSGMIAQRVL
jgi:hypothetical protein